MKFNHFRVFFWKNSISVWFDITPILLLLLGALKILLLYFRVTYSPAILPETIYETSSLDYLKSCFPAEDEDFIFYTPPTPLLDLLMDSVREDLSLPANRIQFFKTTRDMLLALEEKKNTNSFAVNFKSFPSNFSSGSLDYSISSTTIRVDPGDIFFNDKDVVAIREEEEYQKSGFLTLQQVIDSNFLKLSTGKVNEFGLEISPLPIIELRQINSERMVTFGSFFVILLNILLLGTFVVPLIEEKENGIKEFLVLATSFNYLNGITFYVVRSFIYIFFTAMAVCIGYYMDAIGSIPIAYILLLFGVYVFSTMCYAFLISVFFNSIFYAKVGGCIMLIVPYIIFLTVGEFSHICVYIFSTGTFLEGVKVLQIFTNKRQEFGLESLLTQVTPGSFCPATIFGILIVQAIVYTILYLYLSFVFPGKGGMKHSFFFIFESSFWKSQFWCSDDIEMGSMHGESITIRKLCKVYQKGCMGEQKLVVNDLDMDIGKNRITVLLGHNGAGKTTTINMIIGSVPRTSGTIVVGGDANVETYRHAIGYCPQHTVSMHYMTCEEHLKLFGQLRGLSRSEAALQTRTLLQQLKLEDKAAEVGKRLSGGMKRRLSLGMAIIGNTEVVILDEPSSGLDVESRRELWNILLELRKTKSILITTHHMEEAEILGDTVSILSHGQMIVTGTTIQLKRKYGCGYVLKLLVNDQRFDLQGTFGIIRDYVAEASIKHHVPPTLCFSLPYDFVERFPLLLSKLEEHKATLGIVTISVADSTLEDVFLNCESSDQTDSTSHRISTESAQLVHAPSKKIRKDVINLNKDPKMLAHQTFAVLYKKFIYIRREIWYFLFMFSIPFITTAIALYLVSSQEQFSEVKSLRLNLNHANNNKTIIYLKSSSEFKEIRTILESEIRKFNVLPMDVKTDENEFEKVLLAMQSDHLPNYYETVMGAIDIDNVSSQPTFRVYFSNNFVHSSAILINLVDNAILKYHSDESESIGTAYLPIHRIADISPRRLEYYAGIVPIGLFFYMLFYVSLPFKEENTKFKYLQAMPRITYWLSFTLFDVIVHCCTCALLYVFQTAFMSENLYNSSELAWITVTFAFYGISYLPILYVMASVCRSMSTLSTYLFFLLIISSILPLITSGSYQAMTDHEGWIAVLCFLPDFALNHQLRVINENFFISRRNEMAKEKTINVNFNRVQLPLLDMMRYYFYATLLLVVFELFLITVWEDINKRANLRTLHSLPSRLCCGFRAKYKINHPASQKEEVEAEKSKVDGILEDQRECDYPLLVSNLQKTYNNTEYAVQGLNFAVKKGECFGLLGVNGAGKTTTFQMMTVNENITTGTVLIDGVNLKTQENLYKLRFGYCPQADCLNNFMTSYEILKYMALLRGTSIKTVDREVSSWLARLDLTKYRNLQIRYYSGGTKRKLNAAIAMIGNPSLVLLDEPTTGVDPISRRYMWQCIKNFQNENKTIVLTSHSMDECEQLCNRLAIMAKGQIQCIGHIPILKAKYGSGFTINLRVKDINMVFCDIGCDLDSRIAQVNQAMMSTFAGCELREQHAGMLTFFVREANIIWSLIFEQLLAVIRTHEHLIQEYSINETTLEDIFLTFDSSGG